MATDMKTFRSIFLILSFVLLGVQAHAQGTRPGDMTASSAIVGSQIVWCPTGTTADFKCTFTQIDTFITSTAATWTAAQVFAPATVAGPYTVTFTNGSKSYYGAVIAKGTTSDGSSYSLTGLDSNNRPTFSFENDGRLDVISYTTVPTMTLTSYQASTSAGTTGHYAFVAYDSVGNPSTTGYLLNNFVSNTGTSLSTSLQLSFMNNVNAYPSGTYAYQQPNASVTISPAGLDLPSIPITNVATGTVNINSAIYANSGGNVGINRNTVANPLTVSTLTTDLNLVVKNQSSTVGLQALNDAASTFEPMDIDSSNLCLNCNTNSQVGLGSGLFIVPGSLALTGSAAANSGTCLIGTRSVAGNTAGTFTASATCSGGTIVFTFAKAVGHGWSCKMNDRTTPTNLMNQTASTTTTATFTGNMTSGDNMDFSCLGF